ncbi:MAG: type II secretion system protein GspM [Desulfocapsaceae bacterium]
MNSNHIFDRLRDTLQTDRLTRRERVFILGGTMFVLMFLVYQFGIEPFFQKKERLEQALARQRAALVEMQLLQRQYQELKADRGDILERVKRRNPDFNLFTFVEQRATAVRVKDRLTSMKPGTTSWQNGLRQSEVEVKVEAIVLSQLIDFLIEIESIENAAFVRRIVVQKSRQESGLLDALIAVVTLEKQEEIR